LIKPDLTKIVGKMITGVLLKENVKGFGSQPQTMLLLVFSDGTFYEFYGDIAPTSGLRPDGLSGARNYDRQGMNTIFEAIMDRNGSPLRTI
jgi:hypothetical protein